MRSFIVIAMFATSLAHAAWNGYTEDRTLELDTDGVSRLDRGPWTIVRNYTANPREVEVGAGVRRMFAPGTHRLARTNSR